MANYAKTPLFGILRKAMKLALAANKADVSTEEIIQRSEEAALLSRRKFLENTAKTALLTRFSSLYTEESFGRVFQKSAPRIVIVGAGLAGLNALHTLKKVGIDATIYEASGRTSGRIMSVQGAMGASTWTEFGAEFIDTTHTDMWELAKEFNLELMDSMQPSETKLIKETYFFNGQHYTEKDIVEAFRAFAPRLKRDQESLPKNIDYTNKNKRVKRFDNMSISEYLTNIGARGWIKRFIETAYTSEYGLSADVQSSLNFLLYISPDTEGGHLDLYGDSDERYKVRGGNQSIPDAIAAKYTDHIELNRSLESIKKVGNHYEMTFSSLKNVVTADFVIIAIPFTKLRNVSIQVPMPQVKWDVINQLGYGMNAKLMLGMKSHFWREQGFAGIVYADNGVSNGWDNAQLQTGDSETAGLSILLGGKAGLDVGKGSVNSQKDIYLPLWEQIYKGATEQFNGKVARMHWASYPYSLGCYTCYTTGQYTSISGAEAMPIGNIFFAGEHCDAEFSGFMNGAAKSGREAANTVLAKLI